MPGDATVDEMVASEMISQFFKATDIHGGWDIHGRLWALKLGLKLGPRCRGRNIFWNVESAWCIM